MKIKTSFDIYIYFLALLLQACAPNATQNDLKSINNTGTAESVPKSEYNHFPSHLVSKIESNVICMFQDMRDHYWFGTQNAGVFRYDGIELIQFTNKDGLCDNQVQSIQQDQAGAIWFGTGNFGISKFDGTSIHCMVNSKTEVASVDWQSESGALWFCANDGAYKYSGNSVSHVPFSLTGNNTSSATSGNLGPQSVYCILKDRNDGVWFGTQSEGVCYFNPTESISDKNSVQWFNDKGLAGPAVLALFEDHLGDIWMGNNGSGLFHYDGLSLTNFTSEHNLSNDAFRKNGAEGPGTLARIYAINEDKTGVLWFGTADAGVWRYDRETLTNFTTHDGLTNNAITTIFRDKKDELWFATEDGGIFKFNGTIFTKFEFNKI